MTRLQGSASHCLANVKSCPAVKAGLPSHVEVEFDSSGRSGDSITSTRGGWGTRSRRGCARLIVSYSKCQDNSRYFWWYSSAVYHLPAGAISVTIFLLGKLVSAERRIHLAYYFSWTCCVTSFAIFSCSAPW